MPVQVVNVRGIKDPGQRAQVVYCGRPVPRQGWPGHPLANPFKLEDFGGNREAVLDAYRAWLLARPTLEADLAALWEATGHGARPLGCWCVPLLCHASLLAELLDARFGGAAHGAHPEAD